MNLYIDFDGVIIDTYSVIFKEKGKNVFKEMNEKELTEYFANFDWEHLDIDSLILNDSINSIKKLIESDRFNISILSHINSLKEGVIKVKYLRRYFNDITIILCPKEISKTKMVHTKDAILVDDYSGNLEEWEKEKGTPIKFDTENEHKKYKTINKLDQLLDIF